MLSYAGRKLKQGSGTARTMAAATSALPGQAPTVATEPVALPWLAFSAQTFIWGTTFLAIRVSNDAGYAPFAATFARLALAGVLLLAFTFARGIALPRGRELFVSVVAGFLIFGVNFSLLYWGELTVSSGPAAVMWAIFPILTALGAHMFLAGKEPLRVRVIVGALVAGAGLVAIFWSELSIHAPVLGLVAILGGIVAAMFAGLLVKRFAHDVHPAAFNGIGSLVGAAFAAPLAFLFGSGLAAPPSSLATIATVYLALVGGTAFLVWSWLLKRWPATRVSFQTVLSPIIAVVLGALLLREPIGPTFLAGVALVLAGTFVAVRAPKS